MIGLLLVSIISHSCLAQETPIVLGDCSTINCITAHKQRPFDLSKAYLRMEASAVAHRAQLERTAYQLSQSVVLVASSAHTDFVSAL